MPGRVDIVAICCSGKDVRTAPHVGLCRIYQRINGFDFHLRSFDARIGIAGVKRMRTIALAFVVVFVSASGAFAHVEPHGEQAVWTFDPWVITPLLTFGLLYAFGGLLLWLRTRTTRHARGWHALAFVGGWLTLVGALVSPLHWLGERLFSFHMIEHEILMAVSAPLLVLARPVGALLLSLPRRIRVAVVRLLRRPSINLMWQWLSAGRNATLIHGIAIWAWHAPVLFDSAVTNVTMHRLQHLSFLLTAVIFWWSVLRRSNPGLAAWHLFIKMLHSSVLGAFMALVPRFPSAPQTGTPAAWGLTPLARQRPDGPMLLLRAATHYAGAALVLTAFWIRYASETGRRSDAVRAL